MPVATIAAIIPAIVPSILFLGLTTGDNLCFPNLEPISYANVSVAVAHTNAKITNILPCGSINNNFNF